MDYKEKYLKGLEEAKKTLDSLDENYRCHEVTKDDIRVIYSRLFPELTESEDERIRKELIFFLKKEIPQCSIKEHADKLKAFVSYLESLKEPKAVDISANFEKAEKEKKDFVTNEFIQCIKKVKGFNKGETYWLEYIGDDTYVGRSDNVLNSTFNITPKELFTHFRRLFEYDENGDLILSEFESALFSAFSDAWQSYLKGEDVNVAQWAKEHSEELSKIALTGRVWKIMPIFNVGDFIKKKGENYVPWKITEVNEEGGYYCGNYQHGYPTELMFRDQRDYERVDNPGMEAPKINGKPVSTENNVVNISYWVPSVDQLEAVRYLLEDYKPWLLSASEARKELATIYDEMLKLAKK